MSFSGPSGGRSSSFGKKGFSPSQKKEKKKRQEYHRHKVRFSEQEQELSFEQLKERVCVSLDKLGHQVFSNEPGSYSFENWMKGFNLLLDDLEQKVGGQILPKEYYDMRLKLNTDLLTPVDTSQIDKEIARVQDELESTRDDIAKVSRGSQSHDETGSNESTAGMINQLKKDQRESEEEITNTRDELERQKSKEKNKGSSIFKKIFSSSSETSAKSLQIKLNSLIAKKQKIDDELGSLEEKRKNEERKRQRDISEEIGKLRETLESKQKVIGELEQQKLGLLQLTEARINATKSMSDVISSIHLEEPKNEDYSSEEEGSYNKT